jgi:hypothetical protein
MRISRFRVHTQAVSSTKLWPPRLLPPLAVYLTVERFVFVDTVGAGKVYLAITVQAGRRFLFVQCRQDIMRKPCVCRAGGLDKERTDVV